MKKPKAKSVIEETFALHVRASKLPAPRREYRFHQTRMFRFDFAWPEMLLAVECDGGTWTNGRHNRPAGYERDCLKLALANEAGWRVYRFTGTQIMQGIAIGFIEREILKRQPGNDAVRSQFGSKYQPSSVS